MGAFTRINRGILGVDADETVYAWPHPCTAGICTLERWRQGRPRRTCSRVLKVALRLGQHGRMPRRLVAPGSAVDHPVIGMGAHSRGLQSAAAHLGDVAPFGFISPAALSLRARIGRQIRPASMEITSVLEKYSISQTASTNVVCVSHVSSRR